MSNEKDENERMGTKKDGGDRGGTEEAWEGQKMRDKGRGGLRRTDETGESLRRRTEEVGEGHRRPEIEGGCRRGMEEV